MLCSWSVSNFVSVLFFRVNDLFAEILIIQSQFAGCSNQGQRILNYEDLMSEVSCRLCTSIIDEKELFFCRSVYNAEIICKT